MNQEIFERKLLDIYQGQLLSYIEEELAKEVRDPDAFFIARQRIPPINFCRRIVDKLAKTYVEGAQRETENPKDQELLTYYSDCMKVDVNFARADKLLELHKYVALEPFWYNGMPKCRVIPADRFKVLSDDPVDPFQPTIFVKYVGISKPSLTEQVSDSGVQINDASTESQNICQYYIYTNKEFVIVDVCWKDKENYSMSIRDDVMNEFGITNDTNPYGVIPFVYVRRPDIDKLIPFPDTDMYRMTTLIPRILADLNYAVQFNSHSRFVAIDVDPDSIKGNPDSLWTLKSVEGEGKSPSITTLSPTVDVVGVSQLIEMQVGLWLQSKGIRAGATGKPYDAQAISGIARMIEEMDSTQYRKELVDLWTGVEYDFWALVEHLHNVDWAQREGQEYSYGFSDLMQESLTVTFPTPQPSLSENDRLVNIKTKRDLGIISKYRALSETYPEWTEENIMEELELIQAEKNPAPAMVGGTDVTEGLTSVEDEEVSTADSEGSQGQD